jgi:hypothetical protein
VLYLLDANVLIDADRDYYSLDRVPEFWEWLQYHGQAGNVKVCIEIYEEVTDGNGALPEWLKRDNIRAALLLDEESDQVVVSRIVNEGYAPDLTDIEIIAVGRDPFLIAHAMTDVADRCVVTTETSAPKRRRQNRRIPDVCRQFGVQSCTPFEFFRALNFRTNWRAPGAQLARDTVGLS